MNSQYIDGHRIDYLAYAEMEKDLAKRDVLCINCKHYLYTTGPVSGCCNECMHPKNMQKNMVNGAIQPRFDAWFLRDKEEYCGVSGKWFEEKK